MTGEQMRSWFGGRFGVFLSCALASGAAAADFSEIEPLLQEHCVECHGAKEPDGGLVLESFAALMKGGESGPAVVAGKSSESLLVRAMEGTWDRTGKNRFMPPGKRDRLPPDAIARFKAWIDAGAPAPVAGAGPRELRVPRIEPRVPPRRPVQALAFESKTRHIAVARPEAVEWVSVESRTVDRTFSGFRGSANALAISSDGQFLFAGAGDATGGEIVQWRISDGERVRTFSGHSDAVFSLALAPDGQTLASGGYDYGIRLWPVAGQGDPVDIAVNQGAILGLAFRPDGRVLASVSYDRTAKVYSLPAGARLETFGQALKELNAVAFSPDGRTLLTGGNDNRIRAYRIGPEGREGSNELIATIFAHEGGILRLAYSPDGRTVASVSDDRTAKLFDAETLKPRTSLETQPDWPTAVAFAGDALLVVGRADGSLGYYETASGKPAAPPRPKLTRTQPRGIQRGQETRVQLIGLNLDRATVVRVFRGDRLVAASSPDWLDGEAGITLFPESDAARDAWELNVGDGTFESARVKVWVDDLRQGALASGPAAGRFAEPTRLAGPASFWGTLESPGQAAEGVLPAQAGQVLVFDLAAQRLGSKGDFLITVADSAGTTVASKDSWEGNPDPTLLFTVPSDGEYRVRVDEATFGGSADHFFRLSVGELPFVTGLFPLGVSAGADAEIEARGANLPEAGRIAWKASPAGEQPLPGPAAGWRSRRFWTVRVADLPAPREAEPNDAPAQANPVPVPVAVQGRLNPSGTAADADGFRFTARRGVTYVLETAAARRGSPADTRIEVLWPDGRGVERVRLQALRNSAITFRAETSDETGIRFENWEEMELNDLLWCRGEVMKLFRAPQGPDSDTLMYSANGRRAGYFDTTPMAHYVEEPVYLVTPLEPGAPPLANGLPVFTVFHENDDAARRDLGSDSRLFFTAPADGDFVARITDARGFGGPEFAYELVVREAAPAFSVGLQGAAPTVAPGSGQSFRVTVDRRDGFDGPISVTFQNLPPGWRVSSPLHIEAGHDEAEGVLYADAGVVQPAEAAWDAVTGVATAEVQGRPVAMAVPSLGRPKLAPQAPRIRVHLDPIGGSEPPAGESFPVVSLESGSTTRARLRIERRGFDGVVTFSVDNLPHGVIVENLGLNGITFLPEESEREISLAAAPWVEPQDRLFYAMEEQAGRQTSMPVLLRVLRSNLRAAERSAAGAERR